MKRKRKASRDHSAAKRQKVGNDSKEPPTWPLLRQYYPKVLTLRQHLVSRLSKKRRKKVLHYGLDPNVTTESNTNVSLVHLLDSTAVGTFNHIEISDFEGIDKEITVFTQQLSESSTTITATQGALQQCEVGSRNAFFPLSLACFLSLSYIRTCLLIRYRSSISRYGFFSEGTLALIRPRICCVVGSKNILQFQTMVLSW